MILIILGIILILGLIWYYFNRKVECCPKCDYPMSSKMLDKLDKGYNAQCNNCDYVIINEEL
jgi:transcription elongation factor Elf1